MSTPNPVAATVLSARSLSRVYCSDGIDAPALRGVDLDVSAGEFVAIMGPSGCGKSTLLHLLGGLDRPTSGGVLLSGRRVDALNEAQRAVLRRNELGFVFQFFNLIGNLSVADNIELPALIAGLSPAEARKRRTTLLAELQLGDKANAVPSRLSGGQQQRVALARALVNRPTVLLADEPTGNLDTEATREVLALLRRYHEAGQTTVMVTHDARIASVADRILTMRDGRVVDETRMHTSDPAADTLAQLIQMEV